MASLLRPLASLAGTRIGRSVQREDGNRLHSKNPSALHRQLGLSGPVSVSKSAIALLWAGRPQERLKDQGRLLFNETFYGVIRCF